MPFFSAVSDALPEHINTSNAILIVVVLVGVGYTLYDLFANQAEFWAQRQRELNETRHEQGDPMGKDTKDDADEGGMGRKGFETSDEL
ncbi:hypothetical protein TI39_contig350g00019 [Zymoseptoria brevis]|uniref:Uncharacterized protein n=1 Tax=Zymoseptoria brevis TaxID=1047168 RepID=A0A0F4GQU0_9PEZI|nr:hypothetical protein TI39_contig350g00019 [Zymoseptoria brevis]